MAVLAMNPESRQVKYYQITFVGSTDSVECKLQGELTCGIPGQSAKIPIRDAGGFDHWQIGPDQEATINITGTLSEFRAAASATTERTWIDLHDDSHSVSGYEVFVNTYRGFKGFDLLVTLPPTSTTEVNGGTIKFLNCVFADDSGQITLDAEQGAMQIDATLRSFVKPVRTAVQLTE
jgi:hypothetical protein